MRALHQFIDIIIIFLLFKAQEVFERNASWAYLTRTIRAAAQALRHTLCLQVVLGSEGVGVHPAVLLLPQQPLGNRLATD